MEEETKPPTKEELERRQTLSDTGEKDIKDYDNPVIGIGVLEFDYLIGKLFNHAELLGLPERQLAAYRSSVRDMFWEWFNTWLPNPKGLADVSYQARVAQGVEPKLTTSATSFVR